MTRKPAKRMQGAKNLYKSPKNVPRETIGEPKPTYVYRKDAFKKVKIT
jgi:hypothetical protein